MITSQTKEIVEFKITILNSESCLVTPPPGMNIENRPFGISIDNLAGQTSELFKSWLKDRRFNSIDEVAIFGSYLYKIMFHEQKIDEIFRRCYDMLNENSNTILRLTLEFRPAAKELGNLPWEYIYFPDTDEKKGYFIGSKAQLVLSRHVPVEMPAARNLSDTLRVLVVISEPDDLGHIQWNGIAESIEELKNKLKNKPGGKIETRYLKQPEATVDIATFRQSVNDFKPDILHFIGHGRWVEHNRRGQIAFNKKHITKGFYAEWINDTEFANSFNEFQPYLIFLQACQGAFADTIEHFKGVALQLVYAGVPAVVAMQYDIENVAAINFAKKFYESLANGDPIEVAVQRGRSHLMTVQLSNSLNCRTFGSPVVYTCLKKILIHPTPTGAENADNLDESVPCPYPKCGALVKRTLIERSLNYCQRCGSALAICFACKAIMLNDSNFCPKGHKRYGKSVAAEESQA